jgi:hypothetical protein
LQHLIEANEKNSADIDRKCEEDRDISMKRLQERREEERRKREDLELTVELDNHPAHDALLDFNIMDM